jgi:predicted lactoylglutathione lyase
MAKELWINLPVKDVGKSKEFFARIGFSPNTEHGDNNEMACVQLGEKQFNVLLFAENKFKEFTKNELTDTGKSTETLISFDAENAEEVDETARKVFEAGGRIFSEPAEIEGWMYGFAFADLDGHRWNQVYMDMSKMPKS